MEAWLRGRLFAGILKKRLTVLDGKRLEAIPVTSNRSTRTWINPKLMAEIGLQLDASLLQSAKR